MFRREEIISLWDDSNGSGEPQKKKSSPESAVQNTCPIGSISSLQWREIEKNFPRLAATLKEEYQRNLSPKGGGILGTQEEWNNTGTIKLAIESIAASHAEAVNNLVGESLAESAPPLSESQKEAYAIKAYLHSLDVLRYEPGDDPDVFEEDMKDRRRSNPIAKIPARRLHTLLREAQQVFPKDFEQEKTVEAPVDEAQQVHPTSMLPPSNEQLRDDLLQKLGTIEKES
ncbi:MAG: hypothetical protein U0519_01550 [Candidatus Gracilibacteria bacterium]